MSAITETTLKIEIGVHDRATTKDISHILTDGVSKTKGWYKYWLTLIMACCIKFGFCDLYQTTLSSDFFRWFLVSDYS